MEGEQRDGRGRACLALQQAPLKGWAWGKGCKESGHGTRGGPEQKHSRQRRGGERNGTRGRGGEGQGSRGQFVGR